MRSATIKKSISPVSIFILLFFIKVIFFAFFIIPLWDVPDETGHFSYVRDLAEFKGFPLLGESLIGGDIQSHVYQEEHRGPVGNWIAQHPPLYYLLAAPFYWAGQLLTDDSEMLFRAPRVASALSGSLTLLVLDRIMLTFGLKLLVRLSIIASFASVPMYSLLSSGTNQDTTLAFFCSLATLSWIHFLKNEKYNDALLCAFWLSLSVLTKMTALVFAFALMLTTVHFFKKNYSLRKWVIKSSFLALVSLSLPALWMLRQYFNFGNPFITASSFGKWKLDNPLEISFMGFIEQQPVLEHFFNNFYGLIGWTGSGLGEVRWFQVGGFPYQCFSVSIFLLSVLFVCLFLLDIKKNINHYMIFLFFLIFILFQFYIKMFCCGDFFSIIRNNTFILWFSVFAFSFIYIFVKPDFFSKIISYSLFVCGFMVAVVLSEVYEIYLLDGRMRATHGRYFYPLIGLFSVFFSYIGINLPRVSHFIFPFIAICFIALEGYVWLYISLPFFRG